MIHFLLRPDPYTADLYSWCVVDQRGELLEPPGQGSITAAAVPAANRRVTLLVPAALSLLTCVAIPAGAGRGQLQQAAPYLLEEEVAQDIDELHFALGPRTAENRLPVGVIARHDLDRWLADAEQAGIAIQSATMDALLLPCSADAWSILLEPGQALVRTGPTSGFACELDNLAALLAVCSADSDNAAPAALRLWCCDPVAPPVEPLLPDVPHHWMDPPANSLTLLAQGIGLRVPLELLQGPYRVKDAVGKALKPWYGAAAALLVWFGTATAHSWSEQQRLAQTNQALDQAIEQVYRDTFPDARRVVNARVQMEQRLERLQRGQAEADVGLLPILAQTAGVLARYDAEIRELSYRGERLHLELATEDVQILETIRQQLEQLAALRAKLVTAETSDQGVLGRLRIEHN